MTEVEYLLTSLAEECCEVGKAVAKALQFGLDHVPQGHGLTTAQSINVEMADLLTVAEMLERASSFRMLDRPRWMIESVEIRIKKNMEHSTKLGTLESVRGGSE